MDTQQTLFTVNELAQIEPGLTVGGLRHLIFHRGSDLEAEGVIVRFGRKILIDRIRLVEWLRAGNAKRVA
ncbi:MAG: hypothetical protein PHO57_08445 [Acidithiobacillus sp.]|nr:hypothetical protein [Acidithiobacillus sp.]